MVPVYFGRLATPGDLTNQPIGDYSALQLENPLEETPVLGRDLWVLRAGDPPMHEMRYSK